MCKNDEPSLHIMSFQVDLENVYLTARYLLLPSFYFLFLAKDVWAIDSGQIGFYAVKEKPQKSNKLIE